MTQLWRNFSDLAAVVTAVGVVVGGGVFLGSWAYRGTERSSSAVWRSVGEALVVVWALVVATVTLRPLTRVDEAGPELVPFADLGSSVGASWQVTTGQVGASVLLFATGGALVAARLRWGPWRAALTMAASGLVVEVLQHALVTGRRATTDDVLVAALAGALGGVLVVALGRYGDRRRARRTPVRVAAPLRTGPVATSAARPSPSRVRAH